MTKDELIKRIKELDWSKEHRNSWSKKQHMSLESNKVEFVVFDNTEGNSSIFSTNSFLRISKSSQKKKLLLG